MEQTLINSIYDTEDNEIFRRQQKGIIKITTPVDKRTSGPSDFPYKIFRQRSISKTTLLLVNRRKLREGDCLNDPDRSLDSLRHKLIN